MTETAALTDRSTTAFQQRHGHPMPEGNVWLLQQRAEHTALTRRLEVIGDKPNSPHRTPGRPADADHVTSIEEP